MAQGREEQLRELIKESNLATRWGKSRRTVQRWRNCGRMPKHVCIGSTVFYYINDVAAYEDQLQASAKKLRGHQ